MKIGDVKMKIITKRSVSIVLSLILCFSVVFGANLSASAATVDYVYAEGKYIKNWGVREQVATFLSPNAEKFYKDNNTTYEKLSALKGAAQNDVRSTALYQELNKLMKSNHTFVTDYGYTRYKFQYTDIQNSGKTSNRISSFYSGKEIGPSWDSGSTWNREHTWPNSKGEGNGENDIMMLRPTATSENGSRSNKAYGKGGSYYNPNSESGGKHDLRGDVARIVLYQHVRWEQTKLFGTSGVIESRAVLLEWMEADPVDTWELGRNDAVESITGTRNVFVDYPELAFVLFGEQVPTDYQTPSGKAKGGTTQTPTPDNNNNNQNNTSSNTSSGNQNNTTSKPSNNQTTSKPTTSTPTNTSCKHVNTKSVAAEEARCDAEGYTAGKYCNDCKTYISGHKVVQALGHTYTADCDADCDVCGAERATPTDHIYDDANICTLCGLEKENTDNSENTESKDESDTTIGTTPEEDNQSNDNIEESDGIGTGWWIVIIVGAIAVAGGTLLVIYRKKIWPDTIE